MALPTGKQGFERARLKPRIGVKEEQQIALGSGRAGVHLQRASARAGDHRGRDLQRHAPAVIAAAAVDDNHLVAQRLNLAEQAAQCAETLGLVQHRDDDGDPAHARRGENSRWLN